MKFHGAKSFIQSHNTAKHTNGSFLYRSQPELEDILNSHGVSLPSKLNSQLRQRLKKTQGRRRWELDVLRIHISHIFQIKNAYSRGGLLFDTHTNM